MRQDQVIYYEDENGNSMMQPAGLSNPVPETIHEDFEVNNN